MRYREPGGVSQDREAGQAEPGEQLAGRRRHQVHRGQLQRIAVSESDGEPDKELGGTQCVCKSGSEATVEAAAAGAAGPAGQPGGLGQPVPTDGVRGVQAAGDPGQPRPREQGSELLGRRRRGRVL